MEPESSILCPQEPGEMFKSLVERIYVVIHHKQKESNPQIRMNLITNYCSLFFENNWRRHLRIAELICCYNVQRKKVR
jgi:hypothetical protein